MVQRTQFTEFIEIKENDSFFVCSDVARRSERDCRGGCESVSLFKSILWNAAPNDFHCKSARDAAERCRCARMQTQSITSFTLLCSGREDHGTDICRSPWELKNRGRRSVITEPCARNHYPIACNRCLISRIRTFRIGKCNFIDMQSTRICLSLQCLWRLYIFSSVDTPFDWTRENIWFVFEDFDARKLIAIRYICNNFEERRDRNGELSPVLCQLSITH